MEVTNTKLIRSSRTEEMIKDKIERHFNASIELVPVSHKEWKIKHSGCILDGYRVVRKTSKSVSRLRFEKVTQA